MGVQHWQMQFINEKKEKTEWVAADSLLSGSMFAVSSTKGQTMITVAHSPPLRDETVKTTSVNKASVIDE